MEQLATKINEASATHKLAEEVVQSTRLAATRAVEAAYDTLLALQAAEHTLLVRLIAQHQSQTISPEASKTPMIPEESISDESIPDDSSSSSSSSSMRKPSPASSSSSFQL